jgi:SAM-dependent methyltransferase
MAGQAPAGWSPQNVRETCVCGAARADIPDRIFRAVPHHDDVTPAYFYHCRDCRTLSAVNLHFNPESYAGVPIEAFSIPEAKRMLNRLRVEWIKARVGPDFPHNPVVYDLGAGEGAFTSAVGEAFPDAKLVSVEADSRMHERFEAEYSRAEFVPELIEEFLARAAAEPRADLILLTDVLEHVVEPEVLLALIGRALRPGGFAYITAPNLDSYGDFPHHVAAAEVDWEMANWTCQHLWMMAPPVLNGLVNGVLAIREMSRSFETRLRRDSDYSTFLAQRPG